MKKTSLLAVTVGVVLGSVAFGQATQPIFVLAPPSSGVNNPQAFCSADGGYCELTTDSTVNLSLVPGTGKTIQIGATSAAPLQVSATAVTIAGNVTPVPAGSGQTVSFDGGVFLNSETAYTSASIAINSPTVQAPAAPAAVATTGTAGARTLTETGQPGGASTGGATNNTGGNGGNDAVTAGVGGAATGAATGTNTGGNGASWTVTGGAGGAASGATTADTAGNGGAAAVAAGAGGAATTAATTNTGGNGATASLTGGVGGAASGGTTNNGGSGGASNVVAGNGGNGTQTGGAGGSISVTAGNAGTGGNAAAGNVTVTAGNATGTGAGGTINLIAPNAVARGGLRVGTSRVIASNKSVASPDCAGGTLNLTVTQFLDAVAYTCATAQTVNYPTWQGATGIVQALPGTPAVGDIVWAPLGVATAANAITVGAGTGGTLRGVPTTIVANGTRQQMCRLTSVTSGSETADCWIIGL